MADKQPLIGLGDNPPSPSYGADDENDEDDERKNHANQAVATSNPAKKKRGPKKLQRDPSLEKLDEDSEFNPTKVHKSPIPSGGIGCSDVGFGVKSYLHNFYDTRFYKDPNMYEEDDSDLRYLLQPYPRKRRCASIWWKIFVWIGANFLVFGIIGVLVGYLVPEKEIIISKVSENVDLIDQEAISYNFNLNVCKLVGLILFCIGGLTLTVALLFPSFLYQYFDEDRRSGNDAFKVSAYGQTKPLVGGDQPPTSPLDKNIPVSGIVKSVQPERKTNEAILTKEGMVNYQD